MPSKTIKLAMLSGPFLGAMLLATGAGSTTVQMPNVAEQAVNPLGSNHYYEVAARELTSAEKKEMKTLTAKLKKARRTLSSRTKKLKRYRSRLKNR